MEIFLVFNIKFMECFFFLGVEFFNSLWGRLYYVIWFVFGVGDLVENKIFMDFVFIKFVFMSVFLRGGICRVEEMGIIEI